MADIFVNHNKHILLRYTAGCTAIYEGYIFIIIIHCIIVLQIFTPNLTTILTGAN